MNRKDLYNGFNEVDDDILERSENAVRKKPVWLKWGIIAACLCLIATIAIPVLRPKGGPNPVHTIAALEYGGHFYEAVNHPDILEKFGLPSEITADLAGGHLTYLKSDGGAGYKYSAAETDIELYQYAPCVCDAVYVLRDGDTWYAALFCNFYQFDSNTSVELTELYRVYGIDSADDIQSITEMGNSNNREIGKPITDRQEIVEFYDMTVALWSYGNDDFQKQMFGNIPEKDQLEAHTAFAEDHRSLRVETVNGLRFFLSFYPSFDWIRGGGTMSYFKIDEQMHTWLARNFK